MQRQAFLQASLDRLEKKTGINKNRWSEYFTGSSRPSGKTLEKAAETLGVPQHTIQKWIISRKKNKEGEGRACQSSSPEVIIRNNQECSQTKSMKTKKRIGWVRSPEAAYHLKLSTVSIKRRRESGEYKEGIHYRIADSCSKDALRVTYEYNIDAIIELRNQKNG
ncbi:MAG: helix-turn-helix domain-containing protein [Alphaproteobacteria bacterium]